MKGKVAKEKIKANSILKKLILMAVIVTMLAGDFILPIKLLSIAKEISKIENSTIAKEAENTDDNTNANIEDLEALNNSSKSEDENSLNETSLDNANNNETNNETSESNNKNNNQSNNKIDAESTEADNAGNNSKTEDANNTENNNTENNNETSDNNTIDDSENSNQAEPALMLRNIAGSNLLNANNNVNNTVSLLNTNNAVQEQTKTPEELDSEIKATSKATIEERKQSNTYKTKNDLYKIETFETQVVSGASKDENGNLVWNATTNAKGHEFTFRVNYAISGYKEIPAGEFRITIPKRILRNREENLDDYYIMSLPNLAECKEEGKLAELIYKEDGDYLVVYNPDAVDAGLNGYFEISYATNSETYNYKDYDKTNINLVKNGGTASDEFYASLELHVDKDTENSEKEMLNSITDDKSVFINTKVQLQSTQKRYPTINREWDSSWMQTVPDDSSEYYYLVWEISSYIDYGTQK